MQNIIRWRYTKAVVHFLSCHTRARGQRPNGPVSPYRRQSLLSHLLLFILLTMLSFGCRNHGDAFHPVCACGCLRAWKDKLGCISKERRSKELSHTPNATQSFWLNELICVDAARLTDFPPVCVSSLGRLLRFQSPRPILKFAHSAHNRICQRRAYLQSLPVV